MSWATEYAKVAGIPGFLTGALAGGALGGMAGHGLRSGPVPTIAGAAIGSSLGGYFGGSERPAERLDDPSEPSSVAPYAPAIGAVGGGLLGGVGGHLLARPLGLNPSVARVLGAGGGALLGGAAGNTFSQNEEALADAKAMRSVLPLRTPGVRRTPVFAPEIQSEMRPTDELLLEALADRMKTSAAGGRSEALNALSDEYRLTSPEYESMERSTRPSVPSHMTNVGAGLLAGVPAAVALSALSGHHMAPAFRALGQSAAHKLKPITGARNLAKPTMTVPAALRQLAIPVGGGALAGGLVTKAMEEEDQRRAGEREIRRMGPRP